MSDDGSISLNKFISSTGICSRREADRLIESGKVKLNGKVAQKGNRVLPSDQVLVSGKALRSKPKSVYLALNKPEGITCTTDRSDPDNIIDFMNFPQRIFPIGRLDKASSGLILLTNDGDIVNKILREENEHEKEYRVKVDQAISQDFIRRMSMGLPILGTRTKKCEVVKLSKTVFTIILTQGLNRQIRRMCEYLGYKVLTLKRVRIMHINLDDLEPGEFRDLTKSEMRQLNQAIS